MKRRVLVLGGGLNGLVAATRLARAGVAVSLLEAEPVLGGLCAGEEFQRGFSSSGVLHDGGAFPLALVRELELERYGLRLGTAPPRLAASVDARPLELSADVERTAAGLERELGNEGAAYRAWRALLARLAPFVRELLREELPSHAPEGRKDYLALLQRGLHLQRLGEAGLLELLRILPGCAADWLAEHFASERLRAALAFPALEASWLAPSSAGSSALLLAHASTREPEILGGPAALVRALEAAARRAGVLLRTNALVEEVLVEDERVLGVRLADGELLGAEAVLSTIDPRRLALELLAPSEGTAEMVRLLRTWRMRGTSAKLHLALSGPIELPGRAGEPCEHWTSGASLRELELAFRPLRYGALSERPLLEVRIPSLRDPSLAPPGQHVASILVHYVPYELEGGWTSAARDLLERRVLEVLEEHAPGTRAKILACQTLAPSDLALRHRLSGGHLHHGEPALDQWLLQRPALALAHHATPLAGLWLGGSSSHPGGGVTGLPGWLAAARALRAR